MKLDEGKLDAFIGTMWDSSIIPALQDYIRIPNKSPAYDADWERHGHMQKAVDLFLGWASEKCAGLNGARVEVVRLEKRTPVILIEIPGASSETVLLYGHLDKQPEFTGWSEGLGPWQPVIRDGKLYGRGGADDGYAMFASIAALLALAAQDVPRARCVILIEACEESGSTDLPFYVDHLAPRLGDPSLVVCLDSGCANYDQLWLTTSLRGVAMGELTVRVLKEGVHSGSASGIVPSSFRILQQLIARIEDPATGRMLPKELWGEIPPGRVAQAKTAAEAIGKVVYSEFPWAGQAGPVSDDLAELILNRTWRPQLAVTGIEGLPAIADAGNVMLPYTRARLSIRLPPNVDGGKAVAAVKRILEASPPYGAEVGFKAEGGARGWDSPPLEPWLAEAVERASQAAFGAPARFVGEGGSIPFMTMLGEKFPRTQFVVTGVFGPQSNAHGPNEFLHIATGKRVTNAIARIIADHYARH